MLGVCVICASTVVVLALATRKLPFLGPCCAEVSHKVSLIGALITFSDYASMCIFFLNTKAALRCGYTQVLSAAKERTWKLTPLNFLGLRETTVAHNAGVLIFCTGNEICMDQKIERPVLAERQIRLLHFHLLPILQQLNFNLGWMEPIHIAVQEIWLSILCWMPWVNLNLWNTWGTLGKDKRKLQNISVGATLF